MDILAAGRDRDNVAKKMSRAREEGKQQQEKKMQSGGSFWAAMAALNNRSQPGGESKNSSRSERKKKKTTIGGSFTCAGSSICGTKESAVLSRGSRRSSRRSSGRSAASSRRSLKAPGGDAFSSVSVSAVSASSSFNSETTVATTATTASSSLSSSSSALSSPLSSVRPGGSSSFRKNLSGGCYYEGHSAAALDTAMAMMLPCADCDEVFVNAESLELHRATCHAVSELGAGDTSRNVVELIFRSSWKKPPSPPCRIERILKVRSSGDAAAGFERYRARVMESAASGGATRCAADGNELLRFHSTTYHCSLGLSGSDPALCRTSPPARHCKLCGIIRDGFSVDGDGKIATTATSGLAHDMGAGTGAGEKRAMLVCRVVAGRVKKMKKAGNGGGSDSSEEFGYDSVSSSTSCSSELDELFVFDPRAILPCFVVIYTVAN